MKIGYGRVSSVGQSLEIQVKLLKEEGCEKIYLEKKSGKNLDRKEFQKLLGDLRSGDCVVVTRLDRCSRSLKDLLNVVEILNEKECHLKVLSNPDLDTSSVYGKLIFSILGSLSEFERTLINERCSEGRKNYLENGGTLGRKEKLTQEQKEEILFLQEKKKLSWSELSQRFGVSRQTIWRILKNQTPK